MRRASVAEAGRAAELFLLRTLLLRLDPAAFGSGRRFGFNAGRGALVQPFEAAAELVDDRGEIVVRYPGSAGANVCGAHHPHDAVRELLDDAGWELIGFEPAAADGIGSQDLYLARARGAGAS